jgi:hypothetical protein
MSLYRSLLTIGTLATVVLVSPPFPSSAQTAQQPPVHHDAAGVYGPYAGTFLRDGRGLAKPIDPLDPALKADAPWTLSAWFLSSSDPSLGVSPAAFPAGAQTTLIAGLGEPADEDSRFLALSAGRPALRFGDANQITAAAPLTASGWHLLTAVCDGARAYLYLDGELAASGSPLLGPVAPVLELAPDFLSTQESAYRWDQPHLPPTVPTRLAAWHHFGGQVAGFTLDPHVRSADEVKQMAAVRPRFDTIAYEDGSKHWPYQTRQQVGYVAPQDPETLPHSRAPYGQGRVAPGPAAMPALVAWSAPGTSTAETSAHWTLANGWRLAAAPGVTAAPETLSRPGFNVAGWYAATVPGTVLTTLVDRGVYPDPDYGLNNLVIPESLNKQQYWYRIEFPTPALAPASHAKLTFNGINYAAEVWLNGQRLGAIKGAFIRGVFDVSGLLKPGATNALAVRVAPPPHPGTPHEQSIKGGAGENGGEMVLDGPTFVATEGWDWIPAIRDRNSGLWQDVTLTVTHDLELGDAQVITHLPLPDTNSAEVSIDVPVENLSAEPVNATLKAGFEGVAFKKQLTLAPGETVVSLTPAEFHELHLEHPRLWWPNGYGKPELYHLQLSVSEGEKASDSKSVQFGVREVTYELSLYDPEGNLRRIEVSPTVAHQQHQRVVDVSHDGMRELPLGWAASLTEGASQSAAVRAVSNEPNMTDLVLKVNGVRIAARGGNWGMDDSRKRVSQAHLEPFFRLQQLANMNIIRNWVGQDTEQSFYDLADEYGMMVWNDFWESTQNYNAEAEDPQLLLANARDVVKRFRNHPSIVMWCGRNEGVPQPIVNQGLASLLSELDGTRYYSPSSNALNLRNSGPYSYKDPKLYYDTLNRGFSVELGIPSLSTLESLQHSIAPADQWPVSDAWAYHDWHQDGNGDVAPFVRQMDEQFGAATSLADFERKAQMLNYTLHRAIFEGFNQHLWAPNSGRMLWMTQPAWPSNMWQILSSDYDTQASFYGVKKAAEPQHIQLDLSNYDVAVINTTLNPLRGASAEAEVYSLANQRLFANTVPIAVEADQMAIALHLDLAPMLAEQRVMLVRLRLLGAGGKQLSTNIYWLSADGDGSRRLTTLAPAMIATRIEPIHREDETRLTVTLTNQGTQAALAIKLTPEHEQSGERILPAYMSDNYISLLPGESRTVTIDYPGRAPVKLALRGWNLEPVTVNAGVTH